MKKIFDSIKRIGRAVMLIIVLLLSLGGGVVAGFWLASPIAGVNPSGCFLAEYEVVFCERLETEDHYTYKIIGIREYTDEAIKIEHIVPKMKIGTYFL